jgi:hypothetical protein
MFYCHLPVDVWIVLTTMLRSRDAAKLSLASRALRPFVLSHMNEIKTLDLTYWSGPQEHALPPLLQTLSALAQTRFGCRLKSLQIPSSVYFVMCESIELASSIPSLEELTVASCPVETSGLPSYTGGPRRKKNYSALVASCFSGCSFAHLKKLDLRELSTQLLLPLTVISSIIGIDFRTCNFVNC